MDHTASQARALSLASSVTHPDHPVHRQSFRHRGFDFRKRAGTNRLHLPHYMWRNPRDWFRYAFSSLIQIFPVLAPKPARNIQQFHYGVPINNPEEFSFIVVGDTGMNSPGQYLVATAISRLDLYPSEFCIVLGDVVYPAGGEEQYKYGFLEAFRHYPHPVLPIPGNHDWYDNLRAFRKFFIHGKTPKPLSRKYASWASPKLPNWYYFMDIGDSLRLILLDSGINGGMEFNTQQQLDWLDGLLETAADRKVLLMMHHPLYSLNPRSHEKRLLPLIEPRLQQADVVGVFAGHDHNYQRHTLNGRQFIVQGAGGATLHRLPSSRIVRLPDGSMKHLTKGPLWDQCFSFTHCHWQDNQLTCTTVSAHELPGRILDQFVL